MEDDEATASNNVNTDFQYYRSGVMIIKYLSLYQESKVTVVSNKQYVEKSEIFRCIFRQ